MEAKCEPVKKYKGVCEKCTNKPVESPNRVGRYCEMAVSPTRSHLLCLFMCFHCIFVVFSSSFQAGVPHWSVKVGKHNENLTKMHQKKDWQKRSIIRGIHVYILEPLSFVLDISPIFVNLRRSQNLKKQNPFRFDTYTVTSNLCGFFFLQIFVAFSSELYLINEIFTKYLTPLCKVSRWVVP